MILKLNNYSKNKIIRNKGTSLSNFPDDYCILDLETTGLNPTFDSIIEIGILKVHNNKIIDKYSSLVQPTQVFQEEINDEIIYLFVDEFIEELTGITNSMLKTAPTFSKISQDVINFISSDVIVGHNINFDINFLYDNLFIEHGHEFSNNYWDLLKISRRTLKNIDHHRLKDLANFFNYEYSAHRAINDCIATFDILNYLKKYVDDNKLSLELNHKTLDLTTLSKKNIHIDSDNFFNNKNICFTGKLENFLRKDAAQICVNLGAFCENNVTKKTNVLVLGNFDYNATVQNNKSSKLKKAENLILKGQDLIIINEDVFLATIEDN